MRLVLDTNIVVSGLLWGGTPRQLLELGRDGQVILFTSSALLGELADVLERKKFASMLASQSITPHISYAALWHLGQVGQAITD